MFILRRSFARRRGGEEPQQQQLFDPDILPEGGPWRVDIVGEEERQEGLLLLAGPKTAEGVSVEKAAGLFADGHNPQDPVAVSVRIGRLRIGYLSREHSREVHRLLAEEGRPGAAIGPVSAWIHGGWKRPPDEAPYIVSLFFPADSVLGRAIGTWDRRSRAPCQPGCLGGRGPPSSRSKKRKKPGKMVPVVPENSRTTAWMRL